jgi:voltage-gated potassium channel
VDPIRLRLKIALIIFVGVMVFGTLGFMATEGIHFFDALYFMIVTIATVGYGDIHPYTPFGKLLSVLIIVLGVGTFLGVIANSTELMLNRKIKQARIEKLNMVVGVFFSEVGTKLLTMFTGHDPGLEAMQRDLFVTGNWIAQDFLRAGRGLVNYRYKVEMQKFYLKDLRTFLQEKRDFLAGLLENPVLLEHESFTDLLRAVFHLAEELAYRDDLSQLQDADRDHLGGDIQRAYHLLVSQWLVYMRYLKENYPYLFSLAVRINPFNPHASPIVAA